MKATGDLHMVTDDHHQKLIRQAKDQMSIPMILEVMSNCDFYNCDHYKPHKEAMTRLLVEVRQLSFDVRGLS